MKIKTTGDINKRGVVINRNKSPNVINRG